MKFTVNISDEGNMIIEIQGAKSTGETGVYLSPGPGEATVPTGESPEGQAYDAGAAPVALEEDAIPAESTGETGVYLSPGPGEATVPTGESPEGQAYDAGAAPVALEEDATPSETTPTTTEFGNSDGGGPPQL